MAQRGTDLDNVADAGGSKRAKITDIITQFKFPEKVWVTLRAFGPIFTYGGYWVSYKTKEGKASKFYTPCPSYDPDTQSRDSEKYDPWRDLAATQSDVAKDDQLIRFATQGYINMISRKAEENAPRKQAKHSKQERTTGYKDKDSDSYTPVVAVRLPFGAITKLKEQTGLNPVEIKGQTKTFPVTHPKYGRDIRIKYDSSKAPADQYQFSIGEKRTPLTEEELAYLKWDLSDLESAETDPKAIKRDFESWATRNKVSLGGGKKKKSKDEDEDDDLPEDDGDDDEDDEDDAPAPKKKGKAKPSKKSKSKDEDDEEDEDDEDDEDDEPAPKKKAKGKSKPADDEDDEDEDEDDFGDEDDEDDEDDEPAPKKKSKAKGKPSKKSKDEDDEDDEDDEPAPKKKGKAKPSKKSKDEDEDDEDDFDDEDDEEEDVKPKKGKSKPSKKSKDEDEEEDDEDEEEEKPKKGKAKPSKKSKKSTDEDDEDEDEDDFGDDDDEDDEEEEEKPKKKAKKKK